MHLYCALYVQLGGSCMPLRSEYPDEKEFEEETKARVLSAYYYRVVDVHLRDDLTPTDQERLILPYKEDLLEQLSEMTFGKHDGMYTNTPLFESTYKYFTEPIKEKGSPTFRTKGQLSVMETLQNWQWVAGNGK